MTTLVVSPHLDDAVLSCGQYLAGNPRSTVVTIFAGIPDDPTTEGEYDRICGFFDGAEEAITARKLEDRTALARLGATCSHLDHPEQQYGQAPDAGRLIADIGRIIDGVNPDRVLVPLGVGQVDHEAAHVATMLALHRRDPAPEIVIYEELPGWVRDPDSADERRGKVRAERDITRTFPPVGLVAAKRRAVEAYRSQAWTLDETVFLPERYWLVTP